MHPLLAARTLLNRAAPWNASHCWRCVSAWRWRFGGPGTNRIRGFDNTAGRFGNDEIFPGAGRYHWIARGLQPGLIRDRSIA